MSTVTIIPVPLRFSMAYYIQAGEGVLVDAGSPGEEGRILAFLEKRHVSPPGLIYLTHSHIDHFGSAAALQRRTGAKVAVHHLDAAALGKAETLLGAVRGRGRLTKVLLPWVERVLQPEPVQADVLLDEGQRLERFGLEGSVVHTPGHTCGSSTLLLDSGDAFTGDLFSATGSPHVQRYYAEDWLALKASVERICALQPMRIFPGHGQPPLTAEDLLTLR